MSTFFRQTAQAMIAKHIDRFAHLLPASVTSLITVAGFEAALVLVKHLGGTVMPVGQNKTKQGKVLHAVLSEYYGETRQDIMPRIKAYSVPTIEGRMTMIGKHLAGVRLIQAYQRIEAPLPKVGERYCLQFEDKSNAQTAYRYEYFRIADLSHEVRTFEVPMPNGDVREIQRRVVKMEITNPLANDYEGVKYPQEGYAQTAVRILETQVADSAAYYGVKPVKTELKRGDLTVAVTGVSVYIDQAAASRIADTAVRTVSVTETPSNLSVSIYNGTQGGTPVFNTWAFEIGGVKIIERNGTLYRNWDYAKGTGEAVGRLTDGGEITFTAENLDFAALKITAGILAKNTERVYAYAGRTEAAPVKPESFTVYAVANGQTVSGRADADGHITGGITGSIHYETGFYQIAASDGLIAETLRYNAVTQDHIPLGSSIIGIDSVRLPADGRVPIFRKGDMVVIGNRLKQDLGQTFTGGQTVALARQNLDRACLLDAQGRHVSAEKYSIDLAAGKLTFAEPLSLAGYTLPLTAVLAWETMYNCISLSDYPEAQDYLQGVEIVSQSYRELIPQHIGNPRTLLVLDPPYVCTQQGNYRKAAYFGMVEFLRLMAMVRPPFIFFSSTRSELPAYLDLVAELRLPGWERFAGSQTLTVSSTINRNSSYDDHLIYKF